MEKESAGALNFSEKQYIILLSESSTDMDTIEFMSKEY